MTQAMIQAGQITTESVQRRAPGNKRKHAATGSQGKVVTCYNCRGRGHVARECKENKRAKDSQWFKDKSLLMEAKEKGVILDAEAEAFLADVEYTTPYAEPLAITTTTTFKVSHEDAYDSDVDEAPHAATTFMAYLMQIGPSTGQGTSNDTDFYSEIHGGEQLDSDVDSVIDDHDNTIPYHQYQLNNKVESVPTDVSSIIPGEIYVITILDDLRLLLEGHIKTNKEQSFANDSLRAELERYKTQVQNLEQSKVKKDLEQLVFEQSEKLKADNNALEESYLEELVWLRNTNKGPTFSQWTYTKSAFGHRNPMYLKSAQLCRSALYLGDVIVDPVHTPFRVYDSEETLVKLKLVELRCIEDNLFKEVSEYMKIFDELDKEYDQCVIDKKSLEIENKNLLIQNECLLAESVSKDICSVMLTFDIVVPMSVEPRSNCVKEHSRNLELEAEILKMKQLLVEKEKRCSFIETKYQELELKFQKYKECFENPQVCNNSSSPELNVFFEINKLKDQIQGKDELIRKLKAQIGNMKEVSADSNLSTLEFQALETKNTQLKEELTAVRIKNDRLRDENVSIKKCYQDLYQSKAESNSNVSSRAAVPEKPTVLGPGLYAMTPKYIPPQKRNNKEANTPLPRKETISLVKKTNVCVNLSTGIKSVTEASKSKSKCETKTHRNLPARSENVKRVDNPLRSLNKRNRVDSSLSVKRTGFISNSVSVCNICNECLVFGNLNKRGVKNLNSVNAKNPKVNNDATVKQVWKATDKLFASVGSKWRPTGRNFTLGDTCPLTRITKPEVVPLEKSGSVSTSEPANNVIVTPRFSKKPLTSYKRKDRKLKDISTGSPPNTETKAVNDPVNVNDLSANQLDPNKNWVSDVPNSTASLVFQFRTASIRESDTSVLEDLKALSWKTCQGGSYNEST
ncbi:retrovirus-related pol polyprotein from transposon TNT 1-94 [Tanacetum coccineum]